jgi:hypothetical protein
MEPTEAQLAATETLVTAEAPMEPTEAQLAATETLVTAEVTMESTEAQLASTEFEKEVELADQIALTRTETAKVSSRISSFNLH